MLDDHGTRPTQLQLPTPLRLNGEGRITILIQRPSFHSILFFAVTAGLLQAYLDQRTGTPAAWTLVAAYGACILIAVAAGEFVRRVFRDLRGPRMIAAAVGLVGPGLTAWEEHV